MQNNETSKNKLNYNEETETVHNNNLGKIALSNNKKDFHEAEQPPQKIAESFIRRHGPMFSAFAKDGSLNYVPSTTAKSFAFYPKECRIEAPISWFANPKYTEEELEFANYHELAHFIDMRKNSEAYLKNFQEIKKDAEKLAKKYCVLHSEVPEEAVENFYYNELHDLYNVLDDIYVNNVVLDRNHYFDSGDGRAALSKLYADKLGFGKPDQTKEPLHRQMIISLLRDEMIGDSYGKTIIDEQVETALSKRKLGKNIREILDDELKPKRGSLVDPETRYKVIRYLIQPEYLKLLSKFDPFNNKEDSQPIHRDLLDKGEKPEEAIKDILERFNEAEKINKMSPQERDKYLADKSRQEFDNNHNISPEQRSENDHIKNRIKYARREMRKFWHELIGKSIKYHQHIIHDQRKGHLNIDSYIRHYPEMVDAQRKGTLKNLDIHDRIGIERKVIEQPERIDITLLIDCSGSMDNTKIRAAKDTAALLMYSIKDFNDKIDSSRRETRSKLRADTQVIAFGGKFREIKPFCRNQTKADNEAEIIKSFSAIHNEMGSTNDAAPLSYICSQITAANEAKIKSGKLKKIVFEITDGCSDDSSHTKSQLKRLADEGILVIGFQIGNVSQQEKETFNDIWQNNEQNIKGIFIGQDVQALPKTLIVTLSDSLKNIII